MNEFYPDIGDLNIHRRSAEIEDIHSNWIEWGKANKFDMPNFTGITGQVFCGNEIVNQKGKLKARQAKWEYTVNQLLPACAMGFAKVKDGHRFVMGLGSEKCWRMGNHWRGEFDRKARQIKSIYVEHGIPVIDPSEMYNKGEFKSHFNDSDSSNRALTEAFQVTGRIAKVWALMARAGDVLENAMEERKCHNQYLSSLPERGSSTDRPAIKLPTPPQAMLLNYSPCGTESIVSTKPYVPDIDEGEEYPVYPTLTQRAPRGKPFGIPEKPSRSPPKPVMAEPAKASGSGSAPAPSVSPSFQTMQYIPTAEELGTRAGNVMTTRAQDGEILAEYPNPVPTGVGVPQKEVAKFPKLTSANLADLNWQDPATKEKFVAELQGWVRLWTSLDDAEKERRMIDSVGALGSMSAWARKIVGAMTGASDDDDQSSFWLASSSDVQAPRWIKSVAIAAIHEFLTQEQRLLSSLPETGSLEKNSEQTSIIAKPKTTESCCRPYQSLAKWFLLTTLMTV